MDYNQESSGYSFHQWSEEISSRFAQRSVTVMDNATYNTHDLAPTEEFTVKTRHNRGLTLQSVFWCKWHHSVNSTVSTNKCR